MSSRWISTSTYSNTFTPEPELALPTDLGAVAFETVHAAPAPFVTEQDINERISSSHGKFSRLMCEITARVGASGYLTLSQIVFYMRLGGFEQTAAKIGKTVEQLCALRVLRKMSLHVNKRVMTDDIYMLNCHGVAICKGLGLYLHKGLYRSKAERVQTSRDLFDPAEKIRGTVEANNIALRALAAGCGARRFEFNRCLRFTDGASVNDAVFRASLLLTYDAENSLAFDVVRRGKDEWLNNAANKFSRYVRMATCSDFAEQVTDKAFTRPPVFVFCVEDEMMANDLRRAMNDTVNTYGIEPLFTTDADTEAFPMKLYTISACGRKTYYTLLQPVNEKIV